MQIIILRHCKGNIWWFQMWRPEQATSVDCNCPRHGPVVKLLATHLFWNLGCLFLKLLEGISRPTDQLKKSAGQWVSLRREDSCIILCTNISIILCINRSKLFLWYFTVCSYTVCHIIWSVYELFTGRFDANRSKELFYNVKLNLSGLLKIIYDHHCS